MVIGVASATIRIVGQFDFQLAWIDCDGSAQVPQSFSIVGRCSQP